MRDGVAVSGDADAAGFVVADAVVVIQRDHCESLVANSLDW